MDAPGTQEKQAKQVRRSRHGLHALKVAVQVRGLSAIDARSSAAQGLLAWRRELIQDLGGAANLSAQKQALIELAVRSRLYVDHVDAFLLGQSSLLNKKKKSIIPALAQRQSLVDCLARLLQQLGLERQALPVPTLAEYVASKEAQ